MSDNENRTTLDSTHKDINSEIKKRSSYLRDKVLKDKGIEIKNIVINDDFSEVNGRCCENILGYKKIPMGISHNSVIINGHRFYIPICTLEGALVASMCRGIKLMNVCNGVRGYVENVGISRSFAVEFKGFEEAIEFYKWIKRKENIEMLREEGEMNSRFCKIKSIDSKNLFGNVVFVKVIAYTGDAMGMNMITKASSQIAAKITKLFEDSRLVTISANVCTDKKWSIENYCNGRGRKVFLNIKIKENHLQEIMKINIEEMLNVYYSKIVNGGSLVLGGFNCQASNYVAATFIAFNQDLGHLVESSNCIIDMRRSGCDVLEVNLLMPSLVVGTVGGGTHLEPAKSLFKQFMNLDQSFVIKDKGDCSDGSNYLSLAIASAVLAGELSGMSALANNTLMDAHLRLNRKKE